MSDIGYRTKVYSDIRYNVALHSSVRYRTFRYQTQSDIADHKYRTECPPMAVGMHGMRPRDLGVHCAGVRGVGCTAAKHQNFNGPFNALREL